MNFFGWWMTLSAVCSLVGWLWLQHDDPPGEPFDLAD